MRAAAYHRLADWPLCPLSLLLAVVLLVLPGSQAKADQPATFSQAAAPLFKQYCQRCHGAEKQEAQLRLDELQAYQAEQQHLWTSIHERVSSGEMPPEDSPQPSAEERQRLLKWIEQQAAAAEASLGTGSMRRLNRRELSAALQDLTGLDINYADALPGDGTIDGFDTGAEALQDAADSVAQLMRVTRRAVDAIRFTEPPQEGVLSMDLRTAKDARNAFKAWEEAGVKARPRGHIWPEAGLLVEPKWVGERGSLEWKVPVPADRHGVLRIKLKVAAVREMEGVPPPHLWLEVGAQSIAIEQITASPENPQELVYEVQLDDLAIEPEGVQIEISGRVEMPYAVKGFPNQDKTKPEENVPPEKNLFRPDFDAKKLKPEEQPVPFLVIQQMELIPNYKAPWPPADWSDAKVQPSDDPASAEQLLGIWMERAYRRPVSSLERARFLTLYQELREQELSFDEALRATFQSVLLSAPFRYLASPTDPDEQIAQHAIASRLSFMLVGGPPDAELRQLAAEKKLRDPSVLDAQVDRLLDDPRSERFVRPFVSQWLVMDQPITLVMDYMSLQDFRFGRYLKESMQEETYAYVERLLKENRPARELVDSNWTMMNESTARFYGYQGVEGRAMQKVQLHDNDPRGGGILAHAGIQSMLTWMGENWVIYRGAWALRHILDAPPPPPPLEVPELIPSDGSNRGKTFRELLKQHQEHEKCSVCHKHMDPLGFAFQNFDLSGRWREVEHEKYVRNELDGKIEWRGEGKTRPVDTVGQLPGGEQFTTFAECKELIAQNYMGDVVNGLLKNLMLYATGRKPDVEDRAEIQEIIEKLAPQGFPMRNLVKEVVRSEAFLAH